LDGCGLDEKRENREEEIENQKIQEQAGCRRYHARNKKGPVCGAFFVEGIREAVTSRA
jgi:hypothetical protein